MLRSIRGATEFGNGVLSRFDYSSRPRVAVPFSAQIVILEALSDGSTKNIQEICHALNKHSLTMRLGFLRYTAIRELLSTREIELLNKKYRIVKKHGDQKRVSS
jgi:hypothetical protein